MTKKYRMISLIKIEANAWETISKIKVGSRMGVIDKRQTWFTI